MHPFNDSIHDQDQALDIIDIEHHIDVCKECGSEATNAPLDLEVEHFHCPNCGIISPHDVKTMVVVEHIETGL
jgi:predicted RNA-binding Zn-ribbon protein involved in translation (DUF1610 family)